ncbi:MAG: histidinol dehydrogenase [Methanobacteriota archaeon]|nr:MAG: histidinol dehydrogenase [Euryarchaeota archaeon]
MRFHDASGDDEVNIRALFTGRVLSLGRAISQARPIIQAVRRGGDSAVATMAMKFDGFAGGSFAVPKKKLAAAESRLPRPLISSLKESLRRVKQYHSRQTLKPFEFRDSCGTFGQKVVPLDRVGIYAPGGTASYASTVLMASVPARIAGVREIALATPARGGAVDDVVLAAAHISGIDEVYSIGGAHAIAAMAYGTESVRAVDKIVGPGGPVVTAAKLLVRDDCDIDFLAGPSEVMIIADGSANPELIALEMIAQLEHDVQSIAVTVSPSEALLRRSAEALTTLMSDVGRKAIVRSAAKDGAQFVKTRSLRQAMALSNRFAPEHLLIATKEPERQLRTVRNAGSVFLGEESSVAFGDYCAGTNHILPTMGVARTKSSLSVYDFLKTIPYQSLTRRGVDRLAPVVGTIARAEDLPNHATAAEARRSGGSE